jgi:CarD family transcriptional regulator
MTQAAETRLETPKFEVNDFAVHPSHGLGRVIAIEEKSFGGTLSIVYVLDIIGSELKVMVPMAAVEMVGLRPVMSAEEAEGLFRILGNAETAVPTQTWNRRFRAYTEMLASGSPEEIAKVLRDMYRLKNGKELSFGERRLLDQARSLLVEEMAVAKSSTKDEINQRVDQIFTS